MVRSTWLTGAVIAGVIAVATAAAVQAIRDEGPAESTSPQTDRDGTGDRLEDAGLGTFPAAGALPGRLVVLDAETCRARVVDLGSLEVGPPGPRTSCRAWLSSAGRFEAAELPGRDGTWLLDIAAGRVVRRIAASREPAVFSDDGRSLAQCDPDGRTRVVPLPTGQPGRIEGCRPVFSPDGSVLTRPADRLPTTLLRDGEAILGFHELEGGLPSIPDGAIAVIGYDEAPDGLLAVLVARFPGRAQEQDYAPGAMPRLTLELWRGGQLDGRVPVSNASTGFGSRVDLSPSGYQALVTSANLGVLVVVDLRARTQLLLPHQQFGVAWSPDGAWLAVATPDRVEILTATTFEVAYELPLCARALAWAGPA